MLQIRIIKLELTYENSEITRRTLLDHQFRAGGYCSDGNLSSEFGNRELFCCGASQKDSFVVLRVIIK